jgi:hypothetical protein
MWIAIVAMGLCVFVVVVIHSLMLRFLWRYVRPRLKGLSGNGIGIMFFGCMIAHFAEIAVFTLGLFIAAAWEGETKLALSAWNRENLDLWYYSAAFYTSLGADRPPTAGLRLFATSEALAGLMLITWTASFLFLLMQESWGAESTRKTEPST